MAARETGAPLALAGGDVLLELGGPRATLRINREEQRNALSNEVLRGLREGLAIVRADRSVRVVVLAGAGDRAFCAGGDLRQMGDTPPDAFDAHVGRSQLAGVFRDLWDLGKPTVARVPGYALAGGFGLAAACDFMIASEKAVFGVPEINIGLWPYMITAPLLIAMQPKQVLRLMMTGERIDAAEGRRLGFVTEMVPHDQLDAALDAFVGKLAKASPQAAALGRGTFYAFVNHDIEPRLRMLEAMLTVNLGMPEAEEALAAFSQKREPSWRST